jgi:hypothetical protein
MILKIGHAVEESELLIKFNLLVMHAFSKFMSSGRIYLHIKGFSRYLRGYVPEIFGTPKAPM